MAKTRSLEVIISGDPKQLTRAFGSIDKSAQNTESRLHRMGKVGALAFGGLAAAAGGAAVVGLKKSADAAIEAEKAQARMVAQLKASGISYRAHAKEIDAVIQRTSKLAGLDDEDLQDAFTNIVRTTKSVNLGLKDMSLVADIARARHMDVARAGDLVAKVHSGNVGVLRRLGIEFHKTTDEQDRLKKNIKDYTPAQLAAAKASDEHADSTRALGLLQRRFAGQAEAYGKTTAGSMERAQVAAENLGEAVGAKLAPLIAKGANALTNLIDRSGQAAGPIRTITGTIARGYESVRTAVNRFMRTNRDDIQSVISAVRNLGRFFKNVFEDVLLSAVRAALPGVRQALQGIITVLRGIIRVVTGLINGDWAKAWDGLKDIVRGAINGVVGVVRGAVAGIGTALVNAGKGLGKAIVRGIVSAFSGIGGAIKDKLGSALGALNPFGEGLGKKIGDGAGAGLPPIPNLTGVGAGNLMGAQPALAPFAAIGSRFGLHVSSGRRPGSITSSGNISYHSTGEAIDEAGNPAGMMGFFRYLKSNFGSRLAELIYTPGGAGIKDGRPFTYTGQVARDHYDHVHVAYDTGRPGVGDGIGQAASAARAAGFRGQDLVTILAIAGAESGWRNSATNLKYPDHSIGMWQINQLAHHGRFGSDAALRNPLTNARAAYALFRGRHGFGDWSTYTSGAYRAYLNDARQAALSSRSGASSGSRRTGGASHPAASRGGGGATQDTVSPYEMAVALSDVQLAQAEGTKSTADDLRAKIVRRSIVTARINKVKAALRKRGLRPATRLRLTQELASLRGEHNQLQTDIGELRHPTAADTAADAGDTGGDPNQPLIDALAAHAEAVAEAARIQAEADQAHAAAIRDNNAELKRQTDLASTADTTKSYQAWKALADIMSGQIGGFGVAPRSYTPGTGVAFQY